MRTQPVTLADLSRDDRLMWTYCRDCGREKDLDPSTIPLPGDYPVPLVGKRMKCTRCGSRKIDTKPELCPGGVVVMRRR